LPPRPSGVGASPGMPSHFADAPEAMINVSALMMWSSVSSVNGRRLRSALLPAYQELSAEASRLFAKLFHQLRTRIPLRTRDSFQHRLLSSTGLPARVLPPPGGEVRSNSVDCRVNPAGPEPRITTSLCIVSFAICALQAPFANADLSSQPLSIQNERRHQSHTEPRCALCDVRLFLLCPRGAGNVEMSPRSRAQCFRKLPGSDRTRRSIADVLNIGDLARIISPYSLSSGIGQGVPRSARLPYKIIDQPPIGTHHAARELPAPPHRRR
jgi:hypothetical protein